VGQNGVELAGEAVQLGIGQCQPGQPGQVRHLVAGDLGHERKAYLGASVNLASHWLASVKLASHRVASVIQI